MCTAGHCLHKVSRTDEFVKMEGRLSGVGGRVKESGSDGQQGDKQKLRMYEKKSYGNLFIHKITAQ